MENTNLLKWIVTLVVLAIVGYQLYSGMVLKKFGIPGILEIEFADQARDNDESRARDNVKPDDTITTPEPAPPVRRPVCPERSVDVRPIRIATTAANTRIAAGDSEIDSDDWTSVGLSYAIDMSNKRQVRLKLDWYAQERNKDRSKGDTRFASSKVFTIYSVESNCPGSVIKSINGLETRARREVYFRGKVHGFTSFPDTGSLERIRVQFDGKGRHDNQRQALEADLSQFTVNLSASD